jgi:hypothetical protein
MGHKNTAFRVFVGKLEGKRPLGRKTRRSFENNIKMYLIEI